MRGGFRGCEGGAEGSVTDNHLAPVARAARVVTLLQWHVMGGRFPPVFIQNLKALKQQVSFVPNRFFATLTSNATILVSVTGLHL